MPNGVMIFIMPLHALVTGERDGYYADFGELPALAKAFSSAFVYDGIYSGYRKRTYGSSTQANSAGQFVVCSQNHDQVGNRKSGDRMTALVDFRDTETGGRQPS